MSKLTKRVLSMVLTVLMVVSMVSVFTLPALAEVATEAVDYDAAFDTAYIIDRSWTDEQLAGTDDLTVVFRGVTKTVNPATHKLFNNYDAALAAIIAGGVISVENYFTCLPTFIFAAGDYSADGKIHVPFPARIWGPNAGISPNADVAAEDRDIAWIQANGGWPANEAWGAEAIIGDVYFSTRKADATEINEDTSKYTDADAQWQFFMDEGFKLNPEAEWNIYFDGITKFGRIDTSTTDIDKKYFYQGNECTADQTRDKKSDLNYKNVKITKTGDNLGAWNTTWFWQTATFDNVRVPQNMWMGSRFFDEITFTNTYFANITNSSFLFNVWENMTTSMRRNKGVLNVDKCVFYNLTGNTFHYNSDKSAKGFTNFTFNLTNSLLYNAGRANWGHFGIYNAQLTANYTGTDKDVLANTSYGTKNDTVTFNIQDNIMYHDQKTLDDKGPQNTMFNGNAKYIGGGRTIIKFNGNRVIGTVKAIPPNTGYTVAHTNTLMDYDFSGNFWSETVDGVGKEVVFGAGGAPSGNASDSTWNWDWTGKSSYFDYDMQFPTSGTVITAVDTGENAATVLGTKITVDAPSGEGVITPASITVGSDKAVVEMSKTADFAELINQVDIAADVDGDATFYVRVSYNTENAAIKAASTNVYEMEIICVEAPSFNEALKNGIEFGGKTFTAANTAVFPDMNTAVTNGKFYGEVNGTLYKFTVDNINVFPYATSSDFTYGDTGFSLNPAKAKAENGNVLLIGSFYDNLIVTYPTTIYGTNAGVNPVDKTNATLENGYKADISADWDMNGTTLDKVMVREDIDGTVKFDGFIIQESIYDNKRSGKDYATFELVFENIVANELADGKMDNTAIIMGSNPRNQNGSDHEFGKLVNDKLTLRNFYILKATTNQILHENSAHTVVIDNMYCDINAAGRNRDTIAFFKGYQANYNFDVTVMNSIFRADKAKYDIVITYDGDRNTKGKFTDDDHNYHFKVDNNVFYQVGTNYLGGVATGALNSYTFTNNVAYASQEKQVGIRLNSANALCDGDNKLVGNITVTGNKMYGFADIFGDWNMGENNPVYEEGFYSSKIDGTVGEWSNDMGTAEWYMDEEMTVYGSDYYVDDIAGGSVENVMINNGPAKIAFDMREGDTSEVEVYARNGDATYYWTDANGEVIDVIDSADFTEAVQVYYLVVEANGFSRKYEVSITAFDAKVFAEDYPFEEGYFGADAVLVTDVATEDATGNVIYDLWQGTPYAFVVGENAVDTYAAALATGATDILVKTWNPNEDITFSRSVNLYTQNYNVNPNLVDGYGKDSPSHGADWAYNPAYETYLTSVRNVSISAGSTGSLGLYGFNIQGNVYDNGRTNGNAFDLHVENVLFSGESLTTGAGSGGNTRYLFQTSGNQNLQLNGDQTDSLTVKNMHVNIPLYDATTGVGKTARLIGEPLYATTVFDGLYVDEDKSAFNEWNVFGKVSASHTEFTIKNSCLLNMSNADANGTAYGLHFEGRRVAADNYAATTKDLPEGHTNTLNFENNIITGGLGHTSNSEAAIIYAYINGYSGVSFVDNYIASDVYTHGKTGETLRTNISLFWVYGIKGKNDTLNCDITITGNIINGGSRRFIMQESNVDNRINNALWTIADNTVFTKYVEDVNTAVADRSSFFYSEFADLQTEDKFNTGYGILTEAPTFKLDVNGDIAVDLIQDITFAEGVVVDDEAKTITVPLEAVAWEDLSTTDEATGVTTYKYKFYPNNAVINPYHNYIKYEGINDTVYNDYQGSVTVTPEAAMTGIEYTATVASPDGSVVGETYTVTVGDFQVEHVHELVDVEGKAATCTEDGYTAHKACTGCDYTEGFEVIPAAHSLVDVEGKAATCEEDGYTAHKACANCDYTEGFEVIPAAHTWIPAEGQAPTCTFPGYTDHEVCTECGVVKGYNVIPAAHTLVDVEGKDATCTEDGYTAHKVCANCDYTEGYEVIKSEGHAWGEYVYNEDATKEADGTKTATCSKCGATDTVVAEGTKLPSEPAITPDDRLPTLVLNEAGNGVTIDMRGSWATRVYWGNIGDEEIEYRYFEQGLLNPAGTDYVADYAPRANKTYNFTKPGYYRFVLKNILNPSADKADYKYKDVVYTFYFDGKAEITVPTVEMVDGNHVRVKTNGTTIKKMYWGNIGDKNVPYSWFNAFWDASLKSKSYKAMYGVRDNTEVVLSTKGYYNVVIVLDNGTEYVYTVFAENNIDILTKVDGEAKVEVELDNIGGTVNKVYRGYLGTEYVDGTVTDYDTLRANSEGFANLGAVTDGQLINVPNTGYYGFCVNYSTKCLINGNENTVVTYDIVYIVENN